MSEPAGPSALWAWRHPRPQGAAGRCIGAGTDLPLHWRRAKRLARRIQAHARRHRLPHAVQTSPLARCADVGRWLRRWGWQHHIDPALRELDFGSWEGRPWNEIEKTEVDAWVADFVHFPPGGGETLEQILERVRRFLSAQAATPTAGRLLITHGGWISAAQWLRSTATPTTQGPCPTDWPQALSYGDCAAL